jgi:molybdenum cofactor guanylyltransferase
VTTAPKTNANLVGVVVCGGQSSRMGRDKAALRHNDGGTFMNHALHRLAPSVNSLVIAGRKNVPADLLDRSTFDHNTFLNLPIVAVPDSQTNLGPLCGVLGGLRVALAQGADAAIITPVDTPCLTSFHIGQMVIAFQHSPTTPMVATNGKNQLEPLVAIYPIRLADEFQWLLQTPNRSLKKWLLSNTHTTYPLPSNALANANTPNDLLAIMGDTKDLDQ